MLKGACPCVRKAAKPVAVALSEPERPLGTGQGTPLDTEELLRRVALGVSNDQEGGRWMVADLHGSVVHMTST